MFNKNTLYGIVIGDIAGSTYEFNNKKSKDIPFFNKDSKFTDDTVLTVAIANAFCKWNGNIKMLPNLIKQNFVLFGLKFPSAGYGGSFRKWLVGATNYEPYNSWGNGSAMRVSSVSFVGKNLKEVETLAKITAEVTHNHKEGVKGACAIAGCIYLARTGKTKNEIKEYVEKNFYPLDFTLDEIRADYKFEVSCENSVPQAIKAFLESKNFKDCIQNAISIGGDSDTIAAMSGAIAGAFYGVPNTLIKKAKALLDSDIISVVEKFEQKYISKEKNYEIIK